MIAPQELPKRLRVRLHAVRAAYDNNGIVQHLHGAFGLRGKVDVTGGVQQCDLNFTGGKTRLLGKYRNAALTLKRKMV